LEALAAEEVLDGVYAQENTDSFQTCLEVVMVAELFVTGDRKFQDSSCHEVECLGLEVDPCHRLIE